jgi:murein DD-endopeptidase MepM/ murein hydrolase activator NlpD
MEDGMVQAARPDPEASGPAAEDVAAADLAQRREWLAARRAALAAEAALPSDSWLARPDVQCPVYGPAFVDDWHYPRSQGRRHLGTDLAAPAGTAVVAMFDGVVTTLDTVDAYDGDHDLAGISVSYTDGRTRVLAAHLDHVAFGLEQGRPVRAGEVIGYVGATGNAQGGAPHLHLGWFVEDVAVNPYPSLVLACRDGDDGSR